MHNQKINDTWTRHWEYRHQWCHFGSMFGKICLGLALSLCPGREARFPLVRIVCSPVFPFHSDCNTTYTFCAYIPRLQPSLTVYRRKLNRPNTMLTIFVEDNGRSIILVKYTITATVLRYKNENNNHNCNTRQFKSGWKSPYSPRVRTHMQEPRKHETLGSQHKDASHQCHLQDQQSREPVWIYISI